MNDFIESLNLSVKGNRVSSSNDYKVSIAEGSSIARWTMTMAFRSVNLNFKFSHVCKSFEFLSTFASQEIYYGTKQKTESIDFAQGSSERRRSISLHSMPKGEARKEEEKRWMEYWMNEIGQRDGFTRCLVRCVCNVTSTRSVGVIRSFADSINQSAPPSCYTKLRRHEITVAKQKIFHSLWWFINWKGFSVKLEKNICVTLADSLLIIKYSPRSSTLHHATNFPFVWEPTRH